MECKYGLICHFNNMRTCKTMHCPLLSRKNETGDPDLRTPQISVISSCY